MKRDINLVRKILFAVETNQVFIAQLYSSIDGYSSQAIRYHLHIMSEGDFIYICPASGYVGIAFKGQEFLEAARDERVWEQATIHVEATIGDCSTDVLIQVLRRITRGDTTTMENARAVIDTKR